MIRGSLTLQRVVNTQSRFLSSTGGANKRPLELKKAAQPAAAASASNNAPKAEAMPVPSSEQGGGPGILSLAFVALLGAGSGAVYKASEDKEVSFHLIGGKEERERSTRTSRTNIFFLSMLLLALFFRL